MNMKYLQEKKAVALLALLFGIVMPMRAQWYIGLGGTAMVDRNPKIPEDAKVIPFCDTDKSISFKLYPEFGCQWNSHWGAGAFLHLETYWFLYGYGNAKNWEFDNIYGSINPYLRYTVRLSERCSFQTDAFLNLGVTIVHGSSLSMGAGLRPSLRYDLNRHFCLQASAGFMGILARNNLKDLSYGFDFAPSQWNLSLLYVFSGKGRD